MIHPDSHLDHGLTPEQLAWVLTQVEGKREFFRATFTLPEALGTVPCGLVGPATGQAPVAEADVTYVVRPGRQWASRCVDHALVPTREVTIIGGPHDGREFVLYTVYGGPQAPREPADPSLKTDEDRAISVEFWGQHGLVRPQS